jgi:hypothetical protein
MYHNIPIDDAGTKVSICGDCVNEKELDRYQEARANDAPFPFYNIQLHIKNPPEINIDDIEVDDD